MRRPVQDHEILSAVFAKMDAVALTIAAGTLGALLLFLATAILLLQSVPENYPVGPHLSALAEYLPGYAVSWPGSLVGAGYGFLLGGIAGFAAAVYWNLAHYVALGVMLISSAELAD
ncbi:MAG: hypothetical protein NXI15_02050 [Gammaproteobacteria bacterium]|jgi:hypothetical protein|nr:hypothetical protein [Gammaproteobacteria bacterium]